jgi:hypothetical protein
VKPEPVPEEIQLAIQQVQQCHPRQHPQSRPPWDGAQELREGLCFHTFDGHEPVKQEAYKRANSPDLLWRFSIPACYHQCADTPPVYFLCLLYQSFICTFTLITVDWNLQCPSATAMSGNFNYKIKSFA